MKAITYTAPENFPVVERSDPSPGQREVLVHPLAVGLCVTDKHWFDGTYGQVGGMVGGHEFCAEVVAVGDFVDGLRVGDRVSVDPHLYCGTCDLCRAGLSMRCQTRGTRVLGVHPDHDGGLADLCAVPDYSCFPMPPSMSVASGASVDPACIATRAVRHGGVRIGDNVVVFGAEDYALFVIAWLRSCGVNRIICADPVPVRRAAAVVAGAHRVLDPASADVVAAVRADLPDGADIVFVSCENYVPESDRYLGWGFEVARVQGRVIPLRFYSQTPFAHVLPHDPWLKEVSMTSFGLFFGQEPAQGGRRRGDWQVTLDALDDGRLTAPVDGYRIARFDDLRNARDVGDLFRSMPDAQSKVIVTL